MANVEFRQVGKNQLETLPNQALVYLDQACQSLKDYMTLQEAIDGVDAGLGLIFLVFADNVLCGSMYIDFRITKLGKTMNMQLLGGVNFDSWFKDLQFFLNRLAMDRDINEFTILGRMGWARKIPDMECLGVLLRKKIK